MSPSTAMPENQLERARETRILLGLWLGSIAATVIVFPAWIARSGSGKASFVWVEALSLATFPGKLVVFWGLLSTSPLDPWGVAVLGLAVDTVLATTLALGLGPFLRLPGVGTWLRGVNEKVSRALEEYPRLKRMAFWGAALFVALPVPGSGWMGGTFAGQLLGLSRLMGVAAIAVGTALVSVIFAAMAVVLGAESVKLLESPWITGSGFLALAVLVWFLWRRFRFLLQRS